MKLKVVVHDPHIRGQVATEVEVEVSPNSTVEEIKHEIIPKLTGPEPQADPLTPQAASLVTTLEPHIRDQLGRQFGLRHCDVLMRKSGFRNALRKFKAREKSTKISVVSCDCFW